MTTAAPLPPGRAYLGQGLAFPLKVTPHGRIATARAEAKIEQSVWLIMASATGERVMRPTYGCGIHDMLFEPNNVSARSMLADFVRQALSLQEPRIAVLDVTIDSSPADPSAVLIRVDYRIHENNSIASVVYPYFVTEGM
ncbi:MAG TPA: GPW/gp25 family protein [Sphingomicrobium sp.]|nr:GPW/gp25 family protein [Sphingomicrobium sp.]